MTHTDQKEQLLLGLENTRRISSDGGGGGDMMVVVLLNLANAVCFCVFILEILILKEK